MDFLKWVCFFFRATGQDPIYYKTWYYRYIFVFMVYNVVNAVVLASLDTYYSWENIESLNKAQIVPAQFRNVVTLLSIYYRQEDWINLITINHKLWHAKRDTSDRHQTLLRALFPKPLSTITKFCLFVSLSALFTLIVNTIKPLLHIPYRVLPFPIWDFCNLQENLVCFFALSLNVVITTAFGIVIALAYDCVFVVLITGAVVHLRYVKVMLEELDVTSSSLNKDIKRIVDHHNMILDYIAFINNIFSTVLLLIFWSSTLSICAGVVLININGIPPDMEHVGLYLPFIAAFTMELFLICAAGSFLADESVAISDAAFKVNWSLKGQYSLRRDLLMIINRSQRMAGLSIGGMRELDLAKFGSVIKMAVSVYTLMDSMVKKDQTKN